MTVRRAREVVKTSFDRAGSEWRHQYGIGASDIYTVDKSSLKIEPEAFTWSFTITCSDASIMQRFPSQYGVREVRVNLAHACTYTARYEKVYRSYLVYCSTLNYSYGLPFSTQQDAQAFADALNRLHAHVLGTGAEEEADWRNFQEKAAAWRALSMKPTISEDVRRHRLLAENAVQEKQFADALDEYEAGLEIDPAWPQGHFNAALISAELQELHLAIRHMRAYLELVPGAPDAPQARDQIVIWESKLAKAK